MKARKMAIIGTIAAVLYYGVLRGLKALSVRLQSIGLYGFDYEHNLVNLSAMFAIYNPLFVGLTLRGVQGEVYINGQHAGFVNHPMNSFLASGVESYVEVGIALNMSELSSAILAQLQTGNMSDVTISFNGSVFVGDAKVGLPVQYDGQINLLG